MEDGERRQEDRNRREGTAYSTDETDRTRPDQVVTVTMAVVHH